MEAEAAYNFSGRPHKRTLTPQELVQEIETGYENCRRQTSELRVMALQRFSLAAVVQRQLQRLAEIPDFPADYWAPFRRKYALALSQYSFLSRWIGNHRVKKEEADAAVAKLNGRLLLSEKRSAELTLRLKEAEEESAALTFSLRQAEERKAELAVKVKKLANFRKRVLAQPKTEARGVVWRRVQYFDSKVEYYLFGIRILTKQSI